ncbi:MAG: fibrobacter succinogenes major paralogous domain-containing protein [Bacteroidales bacterium]
MKNVFYFLFFISLLVFSCQKLDFKTITKCSVEIVQLISYNTIGVNIKITDFSDDNHEDFGICMSSVNSSPNITDSVISFGIFNGTGEYYKRISNLNQATKYYLRGYVMEGNSPTYSLNTVEITTPTIVEILTSEPTNITLEGATLNATINPLNHNISLEFEYGTNTSYGKTVVPDKPTLNGNNHTNIQAVLSDLLPNSTYHFRCKATTSIGTFYGEDRSFSTKIPELPSLITIDISNITFSSISSGGIINSDGGYAITQKGVCWSTSPNPTISDYITNEGAGNNYFYCSLSNLAPDTKYYLRSYATSSFGTGYGNEISFTTKELKVPEVITRPIVLIDNNIAKSGGVVQTDGGSIISSYGICWSTSPNPTIYGNKTNEGNELTSFTSTINNLTENAVYYVRAYAISNLGVTYGNEESFVNNYPNSIVSDIDGNIYHTIKIGTQVWMVENLKTTKYNDGTSIPFITENNAWQNSSTPCYCWPNNDIVNYKDPYGAFYNWYAISAGNPKKIAPEGWHVATKNDWDILCEYLGGSQVSGGKLKELSIAWWECISPGATNSSGFSAVAAGGRNTDFGSFKLSSIWWSSTEVSSELAYMYSINCNEDVFSYSLPPKSYGYSVRCIKD